MDVAQVAQHLRHAQLIAGGFKGRRAASDIAARPRPTRSIAAAARRDNAR